MSWNKKSRNRKSKTKQQLNNIYQQIPKSLENALKKKKKKILYETTTTHTMVKWN